MTNFFTIPTTLNPDHQRVGEQFHLKIISELCCEQCGKIAHNHFECPICGDDYAASDAFGDLSEDPDFYHSITCEECGARFKFLNSVRYGENSTEFVGIAVKKHKN
jgi:DNA-directed RNA polymerase subunit M/transcription elongation factor TFIIS